MRDKAGNGDVTDTQISQQIAVLNKTFGGQESSSASNTGFTFTLAGVDRYNNDQLARRPGRARSTARPPARAGPTR